MATGSLLGWWVGHYETGGVFVAAETANRARRMVADELGFDYIDIYALRVPTLDGLAREGLVDWENAKKMGAVWTCQRCGAEYAITARLGSRRLCRECGERQEE